MRKIKSMVSVILVGAMLFTMAGCAKVKEYSIKEAKSILKEDLDVDKDDIYTHDYGEYEYLSTSIGRVNILIRVYEDEDDAYDDFEEFYDDYQDDLDDDVFDGSEKSKLKDSTGYILVDGEADDDGDFFYEGYYYGGYYYCGSMIAIVVTNSDKSSATEDVDDILEAFGFPKP